MTQPCTPAAQPPVPVPITRDVAEVLVDGTTDLPTWQALPEVMRDRLLEALRIV